VVAAKKFTRNDLQRFLDDGRVSYRLFREIRFWIDMGFAGKPLPCDDEPNPRNELHKVKVIESLLRFATSPEFCVITARGLNITVKVS